jgi:hypothetical protein
MPGGKPAGIRCIQLNREGLCELFGKAGRPAVCLNFTAAEEHCGDSNGEAMRHLETLERLTR